MLILIRSKQKLKNRAFSCDGVHSNQQENMFQISVFTAMLLIAGASNHRAERILTLCGLFFLIIFASYVHKCCGPVIAKNSKNLKKLAILKLLLLKNALNGWLLTLSRMEYEFLKLTNISSTVNQIIFFIICEKVLVPDQNITALYCLMFYNVISYCVLYLKSMINQHKLPCSSLCINITSHSNVRHLALSATKIVLELTKAVIFFITICFIIFVVCLQNRLHNFQPNALYLTCTLIYYLSTEEIFAEFFLKFLIYFRISKFEDLESLWVPVLLNLLTQFLSFTFAITLLIYHHSAYQSVLLVMYVNVYLNYKKLTNDSLRILKQDRNIIIQFRSATQEEIQNFEDVCAVCLTNMETARITPCNHMFHTDCLLKCLHNNNICPLCKRELTFCYH